MGIIRLFAYLIGFVFTSFLFLLLLPFIPFLLLFRLLKFFHDKIFLPRSCDVLWPRPPFTRAYVWLNKQVSLDSIKAILNGLPAPTSTCGFTPTVLEPVEVLEWEHEKAPLRTHDDFITHVKEKFDRVPYAVKVKMVTGCEINSLGRTLLEIKTHPDSYSLCMTRILSALSQGNVTVEIEPRVFYECTLNSSFRFQKIRRGADAIAKFIEVYSFGPICLLLLPKWNPEKVWRVLIAERHQVASFRRFSMNGNDDSEASQLCINSSAQLKQETNASFSITEICDVDDLQKTERLLRATMAELLTSFLAGALRRYFRSSDPCVLHPPDCDAAFAVCSHKSSMCDACAPCDHLLLPIALPLGVEGRIPRLWSLQRQFALHDERCTPQSLKAFNSFTRCVLPRETANKVANVFFHHSVLNVAFMRIHGDVMVDSSLLTRFIPIPPLSLPSRASFVFVQHRDKILLVSSIDRGLFDRQKDLFKYMRSEQRGLLNHLSFRLKTLAQTCVLPDRLPSEEAEPVYPAPLEAPQNSPSAERDALLPGPSRPRARRQSMANLSELLKEVQDELDEMRRNPNVEDRDATIKRLRELEVKIQTFHNGMKSELWGNTVWVRQEKDEAMKRVAELLAPYQRRGSVSGLKLNRKASREYERASKEYESLRRASTTTEESMRRGSGEERKSTEDERVISEEERMINEEERRNNEEEVIDEEKREETTERRVEEEEKSEEKEEVKEEKKEEVEEEGKKEGDE